MWLHDQMFSFPPTFLNHKLFEAVWLTGIATLLKDMYFFFIIFVPTSDEIEAALCAFVCLWVHFIECLF